MAVSKDHITNYDVVLLPVDYTPNSIPKVQFAMDGHLGNNRFSISLSLRRTEFVTAYERGEYNTCDTIATDIVNTLCREYNGRLLEVISTSVDWTFTDLGHGYEAIERIKFALHYPPQSPFSPPVVMENDVGCEEDDDDVVAAFAKEAIHPNIFDDDNDVIGDPYEHPTPPQLETLHSFDSIPGDFYKAFELRPECIETNSFSSVTSNTASNLSISDSIGNRHTNVGTENSPKHVKTSSIDKPSFMEDYLIKKVSSKKASEVKSTTDQVSEFKSITDKASEVKSTTDTTATPNRRKKRTIQRRGLLKFNSETKSRTPPEVKQQGKQRPPPKVNINLGDSRFAVDPSLSKMLNKAASEGQGTDITELYTTNSYCESTAKSTVSEPKRQKVISDLRGLRKTWLSKFKVGKGNTKHYSSSEVDIMESDNTVKCLDQDEYRELSTYDVLCETEPTHGLVAESMHVGNSRLKIMMLNYQEKYLSTSATKEDKRSITSRLVSEVVNGEKGKGNFVAQKSEDCTWYELDERGAHLVVEGSLGRSGIDTRVLELPDQSMNCESKDGLLPQGNFMGGLHNAALMNLKNRKKKRILSSNLNLESIQDLQKQMIDAIE